MKVIKSLVQKHVIIFHIANCGGLWQMIVYGFAGLKSAMWESEIKLEPHLPESWKKG